MNDRLQTPHAALRLGIGLTAALAGLDKFLDLLADPLAAFTLARMAEVSQEAPGAQFHHVAEASAR